MGPQQPYFGPAAFWFHFCGNTLSDGELAKLEEVVAVNPEDVCARGQLVANGHPPGTSEPGLRRIKDLLWMIEHHPEWDGFLLDPRDSLAQPRSKEESGSYNRLRDAWLRQVGPDQRSGSALHNAAMFFAIRQPEFAASLLQRAIVLEPDVALHVERLGLVYAGMHLPKSRRFGVPDTAAQQAFAHQAQATLLASADRVLVGGALGAIAHGRMYIFEEESTREFDHLLADRLKVLTGGEEIYSTIGKLPSRSSRYRRTQCDAVFPKR